MKKGFVVILSLVIIAGAGGGGYYWYRNMNQNQSNDDVAYVAKVSVLNGSSVGTANRYAGVVEPQETVKVKLENGRKVSEVKVKVGDVVTPGQLLFEYDLSSIESDLKEKELEYDRLVTEHTSIEDQIATLEKALDKAEKDEEVLQIELEIETANLNLRKNEYSQESKAMEVEKLTEATKNPEVKCEIDGVIQKIDESKMNSDENDSLESGGGDMMFDTSTSSDNSAFITILSTGAYRVKGMVNEQNIGDIVPQAPIIIRSRVDENQIWKGTMGSVDMDNSSNASSADNSFGLDGGSTNSQTSSSVYPFHVDLESAEGLMLGQHVYIENDIGQEQQKKGVWLQEYYIADIAASSPYVWAADANGLLEKRFVTLGEYDENLAQYEILTGLTEDDKIAYPSDKLTEGMATQEGDETQVLSSITGNADMDDWNDDFYGDDIGADVIDISELDGIYDYDMESLDDVYMVDDMELLDGEMDSDMNGSGLGGMLSGSDEEFLDMNEGMDDAMIFEEDMDIGMITDEDPNGNPVKPE